jgi:hypothetical protein
LVELISPESRIKVNIGRVVVPILASALAVSCIMMSEALSRDSDPDIRATIAAGATSGSDFPMDYGVYLTPANKATINRLTDASMVDPPLPFPRPTWNLRFASVSDQLLLWYGPADQPSLYEGVQGLSNRNGLYDGALSVPLTVEFIVPKVTHELGSCVDWSDAAGHIHVIEPIVKDDAPWSLITCNIPAIGHFSTFTIGLDLTWSSSAVQSGFFPATTLGIENQSFPLVPTDADLGKLGDNQSLLVDVFIERDSEPIAMIPQPAVLNPLEARWLLKPGDSVFVRQVKSFDRSVGRGFEELLLIGAGAFFAVAVERLFRDRRSKNPS